MKCIFRFLLFWIVMVVALFILALVFALPCNGAELARITIGESLSPQLTPYPPEVYSMTDAEFFQWAVNLNAEARAEWDEWYKTAPPRWTSHNVTDSKQKHRSSYHGSYHSDAYSNPYSDPYSDPYSNDRSGDFIYHYREQNSVRHYEKRYLNPDYYSRPLAVINPYCRPMRRFFHTTGVWLSWPALLDNLLETHGGGVKCTAPK